MHVMKRFLVPVALLAAALLGGCASTYTLDNDVQAFSSLPALPAQPTYRFERLPSQQVTPQVALEAAADPALHEAGLRRDDANPKLSVQLTARELPMLSPWAGPWDGWGSFGWRHHGFGWGMGGRWGPEPPWYHREVGVIVRDLASNKVVFESQAASEGPWSDGKPVFPAMFRAALQGFPNPPAGPREVKIQVTP